MPPQTMLRGTVSCSGSLALNSHFSFLTSHLSLLSRPFSLLVSLLSLLASHSSLAVVRLLLLLFRPFQVSASKDQCGFAARVGKPADDDGSRGDVGVHAGHQVACSGERQTR